MFYDYLNNHEETLSSDRFSTREIFKRYNKTNPVQDSYFKKTDKEEYEKNQFVIFPAHIIKSPYFKLIYEINCEKFKK